MKGIPAQSISVKQLLGWKLHSASTLPMVGQDSAQGPTERTRAMFPTTGSIFHINYSTRMATASLSLPILLRIHCMPSPAYNVLRVTDSMYQTVGRHLAQCGRQRMERSISLRGLLSERGDRKVLGQHQSVVQTNNGDQSAVRSPINLHLGCWGYKDQHSLLNTKQGCSGEGRGRQTGEFKNHLR